MVLILCITWVILIAVYFPRFFGFCMIVVGMWMLSAMIYSVILLSSAYKIPVRDQVLDGVCVAVEKLDLDVNPNMCISSCLRGVHIEKTCHKLVKIGSINADDPAKYHQYFGESFSMAQWAMDKVNDFK